MAKSQLYGRNNWLEVDIQETMQAGYDYPKSTSDWQSCIRALLTMFDVKRKPLPEPLAYPCDLCEGLGYLIVKAEPGVRESTMCPGKCKGGKVYY